MIKGFITSIFIALACGLCFGAIENANAATPASLSEYATEIVGKPITVVCVRLPKSMYGFTVSHVNMETGEISFDPKISLSPSTCSYLNTLRQHRIVSYYWQINALETLIHESYHIKLNSQNEGLVECTAMKNLWNYLIPYGFTNAENKIFYAEAWKAHWSLSGDYLVGCPQAPAQINNVTISPLAKPVKHKLTSGVVQIG